MTTSSTCLDLYGFPIKSSYGLSLLSKLKRKETEHMLLNVSLSVQFGKSGRRCKSLQCWIMTCVDMERGVSYLLSRVGCCRLLQ